MLIARRRIVLAGDCLEHCRRRVQQQTLGHRGRAGGPLYSARRTLSTGADLLTDKQSNGSRRCSVGCHAIWHAFAKLFVRPDVGHHGSAAR